MKKEHVVIVILLILLGVVGIAWIISSQPKEKEWVNIGSWNGSQTEYNMTTPQFVITGEEWRVSWSCNQISAGSHFDIFVYDAYTDNVVKEIESPFQTFSGDSYLNAKGRFYMKIVICGNLGDWLISVSEYR
jgi:hypothetical protein